MIRQDTRSTSKEISLMLTLSDRPRRVDNLPIAPARSGNTRPVHSVLIEYLNNLPRPTRGGRS